MEFSHGVCEEQRRRRVTTIHDDDDEQTQQQQQQQHPPISSSPIEKEHMFDKVVTPSDVGKLNRLVIPKQHAEKYFPLDTTSSSSPAATATKGLLLNFEDPSGKPWRFRYSYWNSSQSYVMTKGWSRFVKDKRLDAGDTVSFGRHKDRLFIDWKRRGPHNPHRIPIPLSSAAAAINYPIVSFAPYSQNYGYNAGGGREQFLVFRSTVAPPQAVVGLPMVLDSVPVVAQREEVSAKKFRLFGVNLDVPDKSSGASASSPRGKEKEEPSLDLYM